jgi:hypothetical protein
MANNARSVTARRVWQLDDLPFLAPSPRDCREIVGYWPFSASNSPLSELTEQSAARCEGEGQLAARPHWAISVEPIFPKQMLDRMVFDPSETQTDRVQTGRRTASDILSLRHVRMHPVEYSFQRKKRTGEIP